MKKVVLHEKIRKVEKSIELATENLKRLKNSCKHKGEYLLWKDKYGGYYCRCCEQFLKIGFIPPP